MKSLLSFFLVFTLFHQLSAQKGQQNQVQIYDLEVACTIEKLVCTAESSVDDWGGVHFYNGSGVSRNIHYCDATAGSPESLKWWAFERDAIFLKVGQTKNINKKATFRYVLPQSECTSDSEPLTLFSNYFFQSRAENIIYAGEKSIGLKMSDLVGMAFNQPRTFNYVLKQSGVAQNGALLGIIETHIKVVATKTLHVFGSKQ